MTDTTKRLAFVNGPTDDPHLFRVLDRNNDWTHYWHDEEQRYLPAVNHILGVGFPKGVGLLNWLKKKTEEEAEKILNSAGERGARVHNAIRDLIAGATLSAEAYYPNEDGTTTKLNMEEWDYILSWDAWAKVYNPQVLKHETAVWNKKFGYAGTVDFIGTISIPVGMKLYIDDKLTERKEEIPNISVLLDWKSSGAIYDEYKLQTAAYANCLKTKPKQAFYTGVVRLGTKHQNGGFEMKLWSRERTLLHLKHFLEAKSQFHFLNGFNWQPDQKEIPLVIKTDVPKINANKPKPTSPRTGIRAKNGQKHSPTGTVNRARNNSGNVTSND